MPISLYDALVPGYRQIVGASIRLVDKARNWCAEAGIPASDVIGHRLAPDMRPMPFQVKSAWTHSLSAIEGAKAGVFSFDGNPAPDDFEGLKELLQKTDDGLAQLTEADLEGLIGKDMIFELPDGKRMPFKADAFLFSFSQPNFYFHTTTLYALLRSKGMPMGKMDYLGSLRTPA